MKWFDAIALLTGILGVLLTIFQSIWCWPLALVSVSIQIITFYNCQLYGDMSLNIFYFLSGIYGWFYWNKKKNSAFVATKMPKKWIIPILFSVIIQIIFYYYLLNYFKSDQILFDSILTACSFTCTFIMTKKWIENWLIWMLINLAYVILYLIKDLHIYAVLYAFFSVMALYGFYKWKKQLTE